MITVLIDSKAKEPIYEQIYKYIRTEIINGSIPCGTKLPSGRGLATHLGVSRNTIDMAYGQLVSEGYIEAKEKRGYFVCDLEMLYFDKRNIDVVKEEVHISEDKKVAKSQEDVIDFSLNGVDMNFFPYSKWRKLMKECLIDDNRELFLSGNHQGDKELRVAIQRYLHQSRGVNCNINQIIVGAGSDYMLLLLSRILGENRIVAMENPTYKQAFTIFQSVGYAINPIKTDEQGMQVDLLESETVNLAYVTPSHQFPLGTVMSAKRKQRLLAWANKEESRYIIEDDYDSEFRYLGRPIPALQSQDPFGKVIYIGTLSKAIAPGIRMSYMVLPEVVLKRYEENAQFYLSTVSRIDQNVISQFLLQGHFERHLNHMRKIYKTKHDILLQELKNANLPCVIKGESAGLHLLLEFKQETDDAASIEREYVKKARTEGVIVYPLGDFYILEEKRRPTLLIGFARLKEEELIEGIKRLKNIFK